MIAMQIVLNVTYFSGIYLLDGVYVIPIKCKIMIWRLYTLDGL